MSDTSSSGAHSVTASPAASPVGSSTVDSVTSPPQSNVAAATTCAATTISTSSLTTSSTLPSVSALSTSKIGASTDSPAAPIETVRYATKAYTVFEPHEKDVIVPGVIDCVQHIRHYTTDICVGDRVTVNAGSRRAHAAGQRIVAAIALHSIPNSTFPRIDAVLYDAAKPSSLHASPMAVVKSVDGVATTPERVAITPLLTQWVEQQRQRVANATAADASSSAAGAGGDADGSDDDYEYYSGTRRSTRKPTATDRYMPAGDRARSTKTKRKATVAIDSAASVETDSRATPAFASNRTPKRHRSVRKRSAAAAAAATAPVASDLPGSDDMNMLATAAMHLNSAAGMHRHSIQSAIAAHTSDSDTNSQPASIQRTLLLSSVLHENDLLRARAAADHQRQLLELEIARRDVEQARRDAEYARRDSEHTRIEERASADVDRLRAELAAVVRTIGL